MFNTIELITIGNIWLSIVIEDLDLGRCTIKDRSMFNR